MKRKICLIIPTLVKGGAEKQLTLLATGLNREKFECHVVVLTHSGPYEQTLRDQGVQVHMIGKRGKADVTAFGRLVRKLRELRPDLVHTWLFAANSYGRLAAARAKVPVIVAGERSVDPWKRWWNFAIDRYLLKYTTGIITNTMAVADFYNRHGIPRSYFSVIPNAVTTPQVRLLNRAELCQRLELPACSAVVGAVGRLWPQKGYRDLVWAGAMLALAYEGARLVIVGDGPQRDALLSFRDKIGAQVAVRLVGHRSDAVELMSGFDLLWNGSLYEGQSNTILEAMALGIPPMATDIPGTRDLIVHQESGMLYRPGDISSLTRYSNQLLRTPQARMQMGEAAQERIRTRFSLENMIQNHEQLYERLITCRK